MEHFLFDLDGTLLPMNQEKFIEFYLPLLAARFRERNVAPQKLVGAVWKGVEAMVRNDGSRTNEEAFWECFEQEIGIERTAVEAEVLDFYAHEFNQAIRTTEPDPAAAEIIRLLKSRGKKVYLATNPIFPRCATWNRIQWAGLCVDDFEEITTYENCRYSKPNPKYFQELLERQGLNPQECLMVGNDGREDLAAQKVGIRTYLVERCLEHADHPGEPDFRGENLGRLLEDLKTGKIG